uniref:Uncharacterized protein n=1 Tax=Clastoptera arizonana TaxID=38151 RepID=A0A1B6ECR9_9HEMI
MHILNKTPYIISYGVTSCYQFHVQAHISLIQEPWLYRSRIRGLGTNRQLFVGVFEGDTLMCICVKGINVFLLQELSCRDCTTIRIKVEDKGGRVREAVVSSI